MNIFSIYWNMGHFPQQAIWRTLTLEYIQRRTNIFQPIDQIFTARLSLTLEYIWKPTIAKYWFVFQQMWFLQALFAGSIPEIIDIVKTFPKYNGTYVSDRGRRHVLTFSDLGMPLMDPSYSSSSKTPFYLRCPYSYSPLVETIWTHTCIAINFNGRDL